MRSLRAVAYPASVRLGGPHPLQFGTRPEAAGRAARSSRLSDDARLFLAAYAAGFVAVSMFIA